MGKEISLNPGDYEEIDLSPGDYEQAPTFSGPGPAVGGYQLPDRPNVPERPTPEQLEGPREPTFLERLGQGARGLGKRAFEAGPRLPAPVSAFLDEMNRSLTLGAWNKLEDKAGGRTEEVQRQLAAEHPNMAALGKGTGIAASAAIGPGRLAGTGAQQIVSAAAPRLAASAGGRILASGATGALAGTALAGGESAVAGNNAEEAADALKAGALSGGAGGLLLGAGAEGLRALGNMIRGSSPWIDRYARARDSGALDQVRADTRSGALPAGKEGIRRASERARDEILARDATLTGEATGAYRGAVDPLRPQRVPATPVQTRLLDLEAQNMTSSGEPISATLPRVSERVSRQVGEAPTLDDLLRIRANLDEQAGFGAPAPSNSQLATRQVRGAVRQGIREASPVVAAADDEFSRFAQTQNRRSDILTGREAGARAADAPVIPGEAAPLRVSDEVGAATRLGRIGDETEEGLRLAPYLEELAAQDPAFRQALDRLVAKKAFEGTRLSLTNPIQQNLTKATGFAGFKPLLQQNAQALGARLVLPAAEAAGAASGALVPYSAPFFNALGENVRRARR